MFDYINVWCKKTDTHLLLYTVTNVYPFFCIRLYYVSSTTYQKIEDLFCSVYIFGFFHGVKVFAFQIDVKEEEKQWACLEVWIITVPTKVVEGLSAT